MTDLFEKYKRKILFVSAWTDSGLMIFKKNTSCFLNTISIIELYQQFGGMHILQMLENLLVFRSYPKTLNAIPKPILR